MFTTFFTFIFLFSSIKLLLPEELRKELLEKYTKEINLNNNDDINKEKNKSLRNNIDYNITKIDELLEKYNFSQNYSFFDYYNITSKIKNQGSCGGCWSFAATSSLAYRFEKKYGIDLDLSPQDALSCYLKSCSAGNFGIDPQLNLLINGTVTEGCFPFTSGENPDELPDCPSSCEDQSDFRKYFSSTIYTTEDILYDNREEDLYDFILIIIDQLYTKGPVVTSIDVYDDFQDWCSNSYTCKMDAYSPGEDAKIISGHAMAIVGYGFLTYKNISKYYWLIQNSWGKNSCDKGLLKIEFGKAGVERVAFAEAYLPEKEEEKNITNITEINVDFFGFDKKCNLLINSSNITQWNTTLEINFKSQKDETDFYYYCTNYEFPIGNSLKCFYEIYNYHKNKGIYLYNSYKSLSNETLFILDNNFTNKNFYYFGWVDIAPYVDDVLQDYYISSEGSIITFWYNPEGDDSIVPSIYANYEIETPMKKCRKVIMNDYKNGKELLIICEIQKDEIEYFDKYDTKLEKTLYPMTFDILCGERENTLTYIQVIDNKNYAIFRITDFYYQKEGELSRQNGVSIYADISGDISYFKEDQFFLTFIYYTTDEDKEFGYYTSLILCSINLPVKIQSKFKIECDIDLPKKDVVKFKEIYLLPYIMLYENTIPFEVQLKDKIKGKIYIHNFCKKTKLNLAFILVLLVWLI